MQPVTYLGMLLLLTAQAQTAPSSLHSHLQRHRDRVATRAHSSHNHLQFVERTEAVPTKLLQDTEPSIYQMVTEKPLAPSPYDRSALITTEYTNGRPKAASTETKASSRRETDATTAHGQSAPGSFKLAAARGLDRSNPDADSTNSLHLEAAVRLLRAHAIVKHNKFQREM